MVLNHASLLAPNHQIAIDWLRGMTIGMAELVRNRVVQNHLRMCESVHDVTCSNNWSLYNAYQELRRIGAREEYRRLMSLSTRVPLLVDVDKEVKDRFLACEAKSLSSNDGEPLVFCAITDGIAVGFPSDSVWEPDQLTITFEELLPDGSIGEASEVIDNLTRDVHAGPICDRHRAGIRENLRSFADLWKKRGEVFPNLLFGMDVDQQLKVVNTGVLQIVVKRLATLDESAREWRDNKGDIPRWKSRVTPEGNSVMNSERLREARRFRSRLGVQELFEWHARFGSSGRIHLRFDPSSYEVEIGYIGEHLPL